jgi:hypothetical protein
MLCVTRALHGPETLCSTRGRFARAFSIGVGVVASESVACNMKPHDVVSARCTMTLCTMQTMA